MLDVKQPKILMFDVIEGKSLVFSVFEIPPSRPSCLPSGYDDEFEEPVNDGLQCGICQLPMKDPMITLCGHLFCRGCIEGHLRRYCNWTQEN